MRILIHLWEPREDFAMRLWLRRSFFQSIRSQLYQLHLLLFSKTILLKRKTAFSKLLHLVSFLRIFHLRLRRHLHQRWLILKLTSGKKNISIKSIFKSKSGSKSFLIAIKSLPCSPSSSSELPKKLDLPSSSSFDAFFLRNTFVILHPSSIENVSSFFHSTIKEIDAISSSPSSFVSSN